MTEPSQTQRAKWPLPIGIVSLIYALLFALMYLRPPSAEGSWLSPLVNVVISLCFLTGGLGVVLRTQWGVSSLLYGSYIALAKLVYSLVTVFAFMGGAPPIFAILGIMTMMIPTAAWPVFLVFWLRRDSVKQYVNEQWVKNAM